MMDVLLQLFLNANVNMQLTAAMLGLLLCELTLRQSSSACLACASPPACPPARPTLLLLPPLRPPLLARCVRLALCDRSRHTLAPLLASCTSRCVAPDFFVSSQLQPYLDPRG